MAAIRRAPQGARGLKFCISVFAHAYPCRAPQGARGLKLWCLCPVFSAVSVSRPARGAWVEIEIS